MNDELRSISDAVAMRGERTNLTEDQKKALPIIALALNGNLDALHYIGLYDPDGMATPPRDFEYDIVESLKRFNSKYRPEPEE